MEKQHFSIYDFKYILNIEKDVIFRSMNFFKNNDFIHDLNFLECYFNEEEVIIICKYIDILNIIKDEKISISIIKYLFPNYFKLNSKELVLFKEYYIDFLKHNSNNNIAYYEKINLYFYCNKILDVKNINLSLNEYNLIIDMFKDGIDIKLITESFI